MASDEVLIRPCRPEDIEAAISITGEVFGPFSIDHRIEETLGPAKGVSWLEIKARDVRSEFENNPAGCFTAELGGKVVGYVTTTINELASRGTIANIAVSPETQGLGTGRKLLLRALEHFRSLGLVQAKIETLEWNEAGRHLYPSVGFREVARQIHYIMSLE